jgi:hypothetical protein
VKKDVFLLQIVNNQMVQIGYYRVCNRPLTCNNAISANLRCTLAAEDREMASSNDR